MQEMECSYCAKRSDYFTNVRRDILHLLPEYMDRVFEVGCGAGDTLAYLKAESRCRWASGLELFPEAAKAAKYKIDQILVGNIETMELPFDESSLDTILCLDVLEHLVNPWALVARIHRLLKPEGCLICSLPNVRHFRVIAPLLFLGRWDYQEQGIMDRTHLRFFTKATAQDLIGSSGLKLEVVESNPLVGKSRFVNLLTFSALKPFLEYQYFIKAVRRGG